MIRHLFIFITAAFLFAPNGRSDFSQPIVQIEKDRLKYAPDDVVERLPEFSYAGYATGSEPKPLVKTVCTINPIPGDNLSNIETAINEVAKHPVGASGFRGAVQLSGGVYRLSASLRITVSGIVLRGSADGLNPTILTRDGRSGDAVLVVEPEPRKIGAAPPSKFTKIIGGIALINSISVRVENPELFQTGDPVIIAFPSTDSWLHKINQSERLKKPWGAGQVDLRYNRKIRAIDKDLILLDAPLFENLDHRDTGAHLRLDTDPRILNVGIESLTIDVDDQRRWSPERKSRVGVRFSSVTDAWIDKVNVSNYMVAGVELTKSCTRITVSHCRVTDPTGPNVPGMQYAFRTKGAQLILFEHCHAANARYSFVCCGGSFDSGIVYMDCASNGSLEGTAGSIGHWTHAILYDNMTELSPGAGLKAPIAMTNRGDTMEGERGWSLTRSVAWNCHFSKPVIVDRPPIGQNFFIGRSGDPSVVSGSGYIEGETGSKARPSSLYRAQLEYRMRRKPAP